MRAKFGELIADPRYTFTCEISSRSVSSVVLWRRKPPIFAIFLDFGILVMSPWHQSQKVEQGAQLQTFPYRTASKSFLYSNAFMAKSGAQTLTLKSVTDRQTDKQKNSTFLATPAAGEIRAPPNLAW